MLINGSVINGLTIDGSESVSLNTSPTPLPGGINGEVINGVVINGFLTNTSLVTTVVSASIATTDASDTSAITGALEESASIAITDANDTASASCFEIGSPQINTPAHQIILQQLLPPGSYDSQAPNINIELFAVGNALDAAMAYANHLLPEMSPQTVMLSLADWNRNYGLPDKCVSVAQTVEQQIAALTSKVAATGGQTAAYFISVAAAMGYSGVTITEFNVLGCDGNCNQALYAEAALFCWQMNIPGGAGILQASCNSNCDTALQSWGDGALQCRINQLKPAHTTVIFAYPA